MGRLEKPRYVYFASAGDMIKIGCSNQPEHRLKAIGEWIPFRITLVATTPGSFGLEAKFHVHFADEWSHLEWFRASPRMLEMINDINAGRDFNLAGDLLTSPKHIQKCLKKATTRRITMAEDRAGRPFMYPARRMLRPPYLVAAIAAYDGAHNPAPDECVMRAIERYERELEAVQAA